MLKFDRCVSIRPLNNKHRSRRTGQVYNFAAPYWEFCQSTSIVAQILVQYMAFEMTGKDILVQIFSIGGQADFAISQSGVCDFNGYLTVRI
jgi:hypothetical protein